MCSQCSNRKLNDIMVKNGPQNDITRLERLHEITDNNCHPEATVNDPMTLYKISPIGDRQDEHLCSFMYRLSKDHTLLCHERPVIHLRGRNKIKFRTNKRTYEKYLKSPLSRGVTLWDCLSEDVQKSTTKFKFKKLVQELLY